MMNHVNLCIEMKKEFDNFTNYLKQLENDKNINE